MTATTEPSAIQPLTSEQCIVLLAAEVVGRVGFVSTEGVEIIPVNYRFGAGPRLFVKTQPWGILGQVAETGERCSFEVDHETAGLRQGWSVLMRGRFCRLDAAGAAAYAALAHPVDPWPGYPDARPVQFVPDSFVGRSVLRQD